MKNKTSIPKPCGAGVAKVPLVMQMEMLECGAASLCMVMHYYRKFLPLEQVRTDCGVSRDGSNAKNILLAARSYGMTAHAWKIEPEELLKEGVFPCIIHWNFNHFVVLCGFKGKSAILNDPARGRVKVEWAEFDEKYTGICLTFEPGETFRPSGKRRSVLTYTLERLKGSGKAVAFVIITTTISSLLGILRPAFDRVFLDRLLSGQNPEWIASFLETFSALILLTVLFTGVARYYALRIQAKMAAVGSTGYLWKILHLPMQFFSQRIPGDISDRQDTNTLIAATLVDTVAPLALDAAMMVFYLVIMLRQSVLLSLVGVGTTVLNLLVSRVVTARRVNITRLQQRDAAKLSAATVSGISMIETIKASGAERGFFGRWSGFQASANNQEVRYARLNAFLGMIPTLVTELANLSVLGVGVYLVLRGQFSIGMIMAFQGFLTCFLSPAASLITASQSVQEMVTQMERVDDVMNYPEDTCFSEKPQKAEYTKLRGALELNHVTFGYSKLGAPLIRDFSMTVKPGQHIALVGTSGCGKSTLAKLIGGLYEPWSGSITFDGVPLREIDRSVFTGSLSVIDQDITLFEDTVSENIKLWDSTIEDFEVIMAARDARIHEDILQREGGYQHRIIEGGRDFSGGQRQRLEIARALAQDPTICILDEATSALDAKTEFEVVQAIKARGITCIIIAHRLSTIRDCDEIILLDNGIAVERGTHEELMARNGAYTRLVTCE